MTKIAINEDYLKEIASAIREKNGTASRYKVSQMPSAIKAIRGAEIRPINISSNGTYNPSSGFDGFAPVVVSVPTGMDTSDATLSSGAQMLSGITAYAKGSKYTGTIPMYNGSIDGGAGSIPSYDYYEGSYVITPSTVSQAFPTAGKIMSQNLQVESYSTISADVYSGSYVITPSNISQAFPTAGKLMSQNLVVESYAISFYSGAYSVTPTTEVQILSVSGMTFSSDLQINAFNIEAETYNGSYVINPSITAQTIPVSGKLMISDLTINPYSVASMSSITIMSNGTYTPNSGFVGFDRVVVNVKNNIDVTEIPSSTFRNASYLRLAAFPSVETIGNSAFASCANLEEADFPVCESIGLGAFEYCSKLSSIYFPSCTYLYRDAFNHCTSLTYADFPACTSMSTTGAFDYCWNLISANFPICENIGGYAFHYCLSLTNVSFPNCSIISHNAFDCCYALSSASFPKLRTIYSMAFNACHNLSQLYLLGDTIPNVIGGEIFYGTPFSNSSYLGYYGSIYVKASLYSRYVTFSFWSNYADRIVGLTDTEIAQL